MSERADPIQQLRTEILVLAGFTGQALALLAGNDPTRREALDELVIRWQGLVSSEAGQVVMQTVRDGTDKMLSAARHPDRDPLA